MPSKQKKGKCREFTYRDMLRFTRITRTLRAATSDVVPPVLPREDFLDYVVERGGHSDMVKNFFTWCTDDRKVQFHVPVHVALRDNGLRALYLNPNFEVQRNTPIFTIPYSALLTPSNLYSLLPPQCPVPKYTKEMIMPLFSDAEMHHIADQVLIGAALAIVSYRFGKQQEQQVESAMSVNEQMFTATYTKYMELQNKEQDGKWKKQQSAPARGDAGYIDPHKYYIPYCRMLDDENFDERGLFEMFKRGLDTFQTVSYHEIASMFGHSITNIHSKLEIPVPLDHFRRIVRLVLARVEHLPSADAIENRSSQSLADKVRTSLGLRQPAVAKQPCIVPMLDLLNHSNRPNAAIRVGKTPLLGGEPGITVFAMTNICGGHEICRHYNFGMDRAASFFRFGFLPLDVMTVHEFNSWEVHYKNGVMKNMNPKPRHEYLKELAVDHEVQQLEKVFKENKKRNQTQSEEPPKHD